MRPVFLLALFILVAPWQFAGGQTSGLEVADAEAAVSDLLNRGAFAEATELAQPMLVALLDDIGAVRSDESDSARARVAMDWLQFRRVLNAIWSACGQPALPPGEPPAPSDWAYAELSLALATRADALTARTELPADILQRLAEDTERAAAAYARSGDVRQAGEILRLARSLVDRASSREEDWHAQYQRLRIGLEEAELALTTNGLDAFLKKAAEAIRPYRDTDWVVSLLVMNSPPFLGSRPPELDVEYAYQRLLEAELRDRVDDPALARLYYDLGSTASGLGHDDEARRWYETFLKLAPDHNLAPAVQKALEAQAAEGTSPRQQDQGIETTGPGSRTPAVTDGARQGEEEVPAQTADGPLKPPAVSSGTAVGPDGPNAIAGQAVSHNEQSTSETAEAERNAASAPTRPRGAAVDRSPVGHASKESDESVPELESDRTAPPVAPSARIPGWVLPVGAGAFGATVAGILGTLWTRSKSK